MPVISTTQKSSWDSNVYVQISTRVFVIIGVGYLARSLYSKVSSIWGLRPTSIAAGELTYTSSVG